MDDTALPDGTPAPSDDPAAPTTWWGRHHRQFWLVLAFLVAVTAPVWGGLILVLLFSPTNPFK